MTEIKERIEELNKALIQETKNLQKVEEIITASKNKIIFIRGGIVELNRIQSILDKVQKEVDQEEENDEV